MHPHDRAILIGDCLDVMQTMPDDSVDLIVTSPPYAERRKSQYGGIPTAKYTDWFLPRAAEMMRILKPKGSFVLNIKEHTEDGERSDYVMRLVLALRDQGWKLLDQYIWHKKYVMPGNFGCRLKDAWEHLWHLGKGKTVKFFPDAVASPAKEAHRHVTITSANGSGFSVDQSRSTQSGMARPTNVLYGSVVSTKQSRMPVAKRHPAVFPESIPAFFVGLLTKEGDVVLDPFAGSGTTCIVARRMNRVPIGIELNADYVRPLGQEPML